MDTYKIHFSDQHQARAVCPEDQDQLPQTIEALGLATPRPVLVLIGGQIPSPYTTVTQQVVQTIAEVAEKVQAIVLSGGTNMGAMATIGQVRAQAEHSFPLVGIAPKNAVSWPGGPRERRFLWWGKKRWPLEAHYTHFILTPGERFGAESPWIVQAATHLADDYPSVTVLINGGEISRQDIALSREAGRRVLVLTGTGRLADELAGEPVSPPLMSLVPADDEQAVFETIYMKLTSQSL